MDHLKLIALKDFPLVQPNDNLASLILNSLKLNSVDLEDGDVIVIAQKIVSKSDNRYKNIDEVVASKEAGELAKKLNREPGFMQIILD